MTLFLVNIICPDSVVKRAPKRPNLMSVSIHCKNSGVKLTPSGVKTGPISNDVNLTPEFLVLFQHFSVLK